MKRWLPVLLFLLFCPSIAPAQLMLGGELKMGNTGKLVGNGATLDTTVANPTIAGFSVNGVHNVMAYGARCDGVTDDTGAFMGNSICTGAGAPSACCTGAGTGTCTSAQAINTTLFIPNTGSACLVNQFTTSFQGEEIMGARGATLQITGNGGGVCSANTNGGFRITQNGTVVHDLTIQVPSTADCAINISNAGTIASIFLNTVGLQTDGGAVATTNPIAIYGSGVVQVYGYNVQTTANQFRQQIKLAGNNTTVYFSKSLFQYNSRNYPSVTNNASYQVDVGNTRPAVFEDDVFETGPNMIVSGGAGTSNTSGLLITGSYLGDQSICNAWRNSLAYTAGQCVIPSSTTTGNTYTNTTLDNLGSVSGLYIGSLVWIKAAGAAGADYFGNITACSAAAITGACTGTSVTLSSATSATLTGANVYWNAYAGHIYTATVGGTSGATTPVFPTTDGTTVADNTITWMEYKEGASVKLNTVGGAVIGNHVLASAGVGVALVADANGTASGQVISGNKLSAGGAYGVWCSACRQLTVSGNSMTGLVPIMGVDANGSNHAEGVTYQGNYNFTQQLADLFSNDTSASGMTDLGSRNLVGASAGQWLYLNKTGPARFPSTLALGSDNAITTMPRMPMFFTTGNITAIIANEHMGTYKTTKAITVESGEVDAGSVTCTVNPTFTLYDCGIAPGACTAGQTSTIAAVTNPTAGSSADLTISTANVAAGHYITGEITAGTCTLLNVGLSLMARPQ